MLETLFTVAHITESSDVISVVCHLTVRFFCCFFWGGKGLFKQEVLVQSTWTLGFVLICAVASSAGVCET